MVTLNAKQLVEALSKESIERNVKLKSAARGIVSSLESASEEAEEAFPGIGISSIIDACIDEVKSTLEQSIEKAPALEGTHPDPQELVVAAKHVFKGQWTIEEIDGSYKVEAYYTGERNANELLVRLLDSHGLSEQGAKFYLLSKSKPEKINRTRVVVQRPGSIVCATLPGYFATLASRVHQYDGGIVNRDDYDETTYLETNAVKCMQDLSEEQSRWRL